MTFDLFTILCASVPAAFVVLIFSAWLMGHRRGPALREGPNRRRASLPDTSPGRRPTP